MRAVAKLFLIRPYRYECNCGLVLYGNEPEAKIILYFLDFLAENRISPIANHDDC